jgi:hypothetical protein
LISIRTLTVIFDQQYGSAGVRWSIADILNNIRDVINDVIR